MKQTENLSLVASGVLYAVQASLAILLRWRVAFILAALCWLLLAGIVTLAVKWPVFFMAACFIGYIVAQIGPVLLDMFAPHDEDRRPKHYD